ncbi:GNAT family N-acetyltransferase [Algibacter amylolyticus]|uniref:GNAT family N-acetyltransferase n=1 Tax=Algibacter amylolyticus TaxID=1608400 RepID=A0A5M7BC65_9FLAO|nr:GNAT family N-acetyltransferase [Algibacter amylolyticus]KAA5824745.1 GNAT family N-acetyltransferase [Algibacter amylolyticus]MBB5268858.1 putative acetyltransferase [Algibacter amylolyticus]TSJ75910.1 GNAT family N-acetyltransferase [Algibacter amylolyticus]
MSKDTIVIREIEPQDNAEIEAVIRSCFHEFDIPLEGTAYTDPETSKMFQSYQNDNDAYFVIECNGRVEGGGGVKPLSLSDTDTCEIQKMYFSKKVRGQGYGRALFEKCIEKAKALSYKTCYLESASQLKAAIHIYESYGFKHLEGALGNTGHYSCGVWMIKNL